MNTDNCFLLLGRTGVGKSTLTKILSEDQSIVIGDSLKSQTQETNCYNCEIDNFKYCLIDTPGYDDSNGNDQKNYGDIKKFLTSNNHKIKGIVLLFSFQDPRFGESHLKGLEKIVNLIPLKNFWEYITIIFTRSFCEDEDELEEEKQKKLKDFKQIFEVLISAFNKSKQIDIIPFEKINTIFVNLRIKKTKKSQLNNNIISIFKKCSKLEPLYHKVKITEKWEEFFLLKDKNAEKGDLINVNIKTYEYYNKDGNIIKTLSKPIQQKLIKQLTKKEYESQFKKNPIIVDIAQGAMLSFYIGLYYLLPSKFPSPFGLIKKIRNISEKKIIEDLNIDENF